MPELGNGEPEAGKASTGGMKYLNKRTNEAYVAMYRQARGKGRDVDRMKNTACVESDASPTKWLPALRLYL